MKKLLPFISCLLALGLWACTGTGGGTVKPSIELDKTSMQFEASGNSSQTAVVTANVEWSVSVASTAQSWLKADKTDDKTITVTVIDNDQAEPRTGTITVNAKTGDVTPKNITVMQAAGTPTAYSLTVEPSSLSFAPENAEPQKATVTVSDPDLGWSAAPEEAIKGWVTVTAEGSQVTVTVTDNPDTSVRSGNVIITPDRENASPKAIRVMQEAKVLPPAVEAAESELRFDAIRGVPQSVNVTATNCDWTAEVLEEDGVDVSWIELSITKTDDHSFFSVNVKTNTLLEERRGYIIVSGDAPGVEDVTVTVIQSAAVDHFSTLTENVVISDLAEGALCDVFFTPNQVWHDRDYASWNIDLWASTVTRQKDWYGYWLYKGPGTRLFLVLHSERIVYNLDDEYYLPEGDYTVAPEADAKNPYHVEAGSRTAKFATPSGSWYLAVGTEEDVYADTAPITTGKVTVAFDGENYTLTLDLMDDAGFAITGQCITKLDNMRVNFSERPEPTPDPNPNPDPNPDPDPNPGNPDEPTPYRF